MGNGTEPVADDIEKRLAAIEAKIIFATLVGAVIAAVLATVLGVQYFSLRTDVGKIVTDIFSFLCRSPGFIVVRIAADG